MSSPLVQRLIEQCHYPLLEGEALEAFIQAPGPCVLFLTEDPARFNEVNDVAVVLPELLKVFPQVRAGVVARPAEKALQKRYGFSTWPALVLLRDGGWLGTLTGMHDWEVYLTRVGQLLDGPVSRPPSIGIAVSAARA